MTTDLIESRELEKQKALAGVDVFKTIFAEEKSRDFHDGEYSNRDSEAETKILQDFIDRQALEKDGQSRCMGAAVALLKYAHQMVERAEETIQAQENRISLLEDIATTDDLTALTNRRGFFEVFLRELDRCQRGLSEGGLLILIDLDNFKMVNDTYGHMAGDSCLRLVARTLDHEIRAMDLAARLGGDEFVLLLSNTSKEQAAGRIQNLAWQLNNLSLAWYGEEIPVRASFGLRAYGAGDEAEKIFNSADIALYANKRNKKEKRTNPMRA